MTDAMNPTPAQPAKPAASAPPPEGGWESLKVDELKAELEARGLPKSGKKDELIARLADDDVAQRDNVATPDEEGPAGGKAAAEAHDVEEEQRELEAAATPAPPTAEPRRFFFGSSSGSASSAASCSGVSASFSSFSSFSSLIASSPSRRRRARGTGGWARTRRACGRPSTRR